MTLTIVRYTTRPEAADSNAGLISDVFAQLAEGTPPSLRYAVLRVDDSEFIHLAWSQRRPSPLLELAAFGRFRAGIAERCLEPPRTAQAAVLGNHRFIQF
jgi:hypothetical protein